MNAALNGFGLGLSLILAIGAQNAFVLRQGVRRAHVLPVVLTCAISDAVLIGIGVSGFGVASEALPWLGPVLRWAGAAFLFGYGALNFLAALRGTSAPDAAPADAGSTRAAVTTCLALTWLNPHVYLDTVVLLGSVSTQFEGARLAFALGAVLASFAFFFALGFGARALGPLFARPGAWRVLDLAVGCLMWSIAAGLVFA
ncbi:MAG: LysE/ArgO family amino acid transporter [Alphaproteobacteria bacterium]|nr:LysE/ArgO family amino acid transporter [Alphaproteobacteria bacterium]NNF23553.1 amino acid transporter [Paracoccaceae bacterium]